MIKKSVYFSELKHDYKRKNFPWKRQLIVLRIFFFLLCSLKKMSFEFATLFIFGKNPNFYGHFKKYFCLIRYDFKITSTVKYLQQNIQNEEGRGEDPSSPMELLYPTLNDYF